MTNACEGCLDTNELEFDVAMAFQPIVNVTRKEIFAYEALVRGPAGEPAASVFAKVNETNRYRFDQTCRVKAIEAAAALGMKTFLSINFMPNAVYEPERCLQTTLATATACGFPIEQIIFEVTESERVDDVGRLRDIVRHYGARGFRTAIDDFGAGYAGLNLLADLQTHFVKLDMALVRSVDRDRARRAIISGVSSVCRDLSIRIIAEGVETTEELTALRDLGIELFQGFLFARPEVGALASVAWNDGDPPH